MTLDRAFPYPNLSGLIFNIGTIVLSTLLGDRGLNTARAESGHTVRGSCAQKFEASPGVVNLASINPWESVNLNEKKITSLSPFTFK